MTDIWHEFLQEHDLSPGSDGYTHTGGENVDSFQKLSGDLLCDLGHLTLVRAAGDDAESFLQNQLTNDIGSLTERQTALAGYCNAKGRLICLFRIQRDADGFLLQLPSNLAETALERLRKYVLRARVELSVRDGLVAFGVCGKTAAKGLEAAAGDLPARDNDVCSTEGLGITRLPGNGKPRFQVAGDADRCIAAWQKLQRHATVVGSWTWPRLDILAGIPNIYIETSETFIPQMVNLDLLDGVNFRKGCYPGQEIVARMHYLGNLKQRMARFRVDEDRRPAPGDRVFTQGQSSPTGKVVDAHRGAGAGWDLLAVVRIADLEQNVLCLKNERGPRLFRQDLPYTLITED